MKRRGNDPKLRLLRTCCVVLLASTACSRAIRYEMDPLLVCDLLLRTNGTNWVNTRDQDGVPLLHRVVMDYCRDLPLETLLAETNIDVNAQDAAGKTALHLAAERNLSCVVQKLLAVPGIDVNKRDGQGVTALYTAAACQHWELAQILMRLPTIEVLGTNRYNNVLLGTVVSAKKYLASWLPAEFGGRADVSATRDSLKKSNKTLLELAFKENYLPFLEKAFQAGEDVNATMNLNQQTLLHWAAAEGRLATVQALLKISNINVHQKDIFGRMALHEAAYKGDPDVVEALLGAASRIKDEKGVADVVKSLLGGASRIEDEKDNVGFTPLHDAVSQGHAVVVEKLLNDSKIRVFATDSQGKTLVEFAQARISAAADADLGKRLSNCKDLLVNAARGL